MADKELDYDILTEILNKDKSGCRRRKADWVTKMATILSLCSWSIMTAVWIVLETASPEREMTFITSFFNVKFGAETVIRARWDHTMVIAAFVLLLVSLATSVAAFLFNKMRMKRKSDKYKKSIFIIGGITIVALIVFLIRFWSVIF